MVTPKKVCFRSERHEAHTWTSPVGAPDGDPYFCHGIGAYPGFGQPEQTEPTISEVDRLKGLLERRTEALNRTVKELEAERAKVARVEALVWKERGWAVTANDILIALEDE